MILDMRDWPPPWFVRAVWGFGAFGVAGVVAGLATGNSPAGPLRDLLGAAGAVGLFFVSMLFVLSSWVGARIDVDGTAERMGRVGRFFSLAVGGVFAFVSVGLVLYLAGFIR